jgi:serine protease Do
MSYLHSLIAALLMDGSAAPGISQLAGAQQGQHPPSPVAAAPIPGARVSFADLVDRLSPSVVNISTRQSIRVSPTRNLPPELEQFFRQFGGQAPEGGSSNEVVTQRGGSLGSGFIISPEGYIVTNNHVVAPARDNATVESITVTLADGREFQAELIGRDAASDLAVLKIRADNLPYVRFGDSTQARVGDWVVAIGNPFGLGGSVTTGIVSALHRSLQGAGAYSRYIQTDASINSGNSGGPMFDLEGNVIGINTSYYSPTGGNVGIGFAIPAEQAAPVVDALRRGQRVQRGYLGLSAQTLDESMAAALGLPKSRGELIRSITPAGPADRAGLQQGDVTSVNGRPVLPDESLSFIVANLPVGARVPVEIVRNGRRQTLMAAVAQRPTEEELARLSGLPAGPEAAPPADEKS